MPQRTKKHLYEVRIKLNGKVVTFYTNATSRNHAISNVAYKIVESNDTIVLGDKISIPIGWGKRQKVALLATKIKEGLRHRSYVEVREV